jgi:uncharacterized protein with PQ loop repeat
VIITILAWSGALLSSLLAIPQAIQTLRSDRLEGVSATTYGIVLGNATVWAAWAWLTGHYAAGVPSLVNGPAALLILYRLRRTSAAAGSAGPCAGRARMWWPITSTERSPSALAGAPCQ